MITPHFVDVPCGCGAKHRLPVDVAGVIQWLCPSRRSVFTLRLNPKQFATLQLQRPTDALLATEGVCAVHKAAAPADDQQRCDDCGHLLLSYRHRLRVLHTKIGKAAREGDWWPTGALVGQTPTWAFYLAAAPMSEGRERRCFIPK